MKVSLIGLMAAAVLAGCTSKATSTSESDASGTVGLSLTLGDGAAVKSASYTISGPGGFSKSGSIDVSNSATISAVIPGIPAGAGYTIDLGASSADGSDSCAGSAGFDVTARATTAVVVHLLCHEKARTGSVSVTGTINVCPVANGISANPAEVIVGNTLALAADVTDPDAGPAALTYHWTVSAGSLDDAGVRSPTFTCLFPGVVTINVAASDGDPAVDCTATASVQITCTAASPKNYAFVVLGSGGAAIARVITPDAACPALFLDGQAHPMGVRAAAGTVPQRTTASPPELSRPSAFPVTSCEALIPPGTGEAIVLGRKLALPRAVPNRIVVLGDTGCRLKTGNPWQACSDPSEWPLREISEKAAALSPDLVLHVGDYHYRENACPADVAGCQGSPWGYGFDAWEADVFKPASALLAAAPWIMVRGNHEQCQRAGQGWYRFLDTAPYQTARSCDLPANDNVGNYNVPFAVPIGPGGQVIVFDSANVSAVALDPSKPADALMFAQYQSQLGTVAELAADPGVFSIFSNHHPLLAYTSVAGAVPIGGNAALLSVMAALYPGRYFPPNIKLVLEGHNHIFEAIDYASGHPATVVTGNGGDNLDINLPEPFPLGPAASGGVEPSPGVVADSIADMSTFGFLVMDRVAGGWSISEYRHDGTKMTTCSLDAGGKLACSATGFLH